MQRFEADFDFEGDLERVMDELEDWRLWFLGRKARPRAKNRGPMTLRRTWTAAWKSWTAGRASFRRPRERCGSRSR